MAVNLGNPGEALNALCRVLEQWIHHFFKADVAIIPLSEINDDKWVWHIGLDAEASKILNELYHGEKLSASTQNQILALFKMEFKDKELVRPDIAEQPIYLGMAMNEDNLLRLKPQNLLMNLPLVQYT